MSESVNKKDIDKPWFKKFEVWSMIIGEIVAASALVIPFLIMLITKQNYSLETFENLGTDGDFFGGTTVGLLSFSSILFVIAAIFMQREELRIQKTELQKTTDEFKMTNDTMKKQQFESTFFNMISLHHQIVNSMVFQNDSRQTLTGRHALTEIKSYLNNLYNNPSIDLLDSTGRRISDEKKRIQATYQKFYNKLEPELGHYFRNLYRIIKWIDESKLDKEAKNNYLGIIRAQLSSSELVLLFYNNSTANGAKFKKFVDKYDFFDDHLSDKMLIKPEHKELLS